MKRDQAVIDAAVARLRALRDEPNTDLDWLDLVPLAPEIPTTRDETVAVVLARVSDKVTSA
jgi:hypothetical protein